jgi:tetratricopeptide (TPR) repeat protein
MNTLATPTDALQVAKMAEIYREIAIECTFHQQYRKAAHFLFVSSMLDNDAMLQRNNHLDVLISYMHKIENALAKGEQSPCSYFEDKSCDDTTAQIFMHKTAASNLHIKIQVGFASAEVSGSAQKRQMSLQAAQTDYKAMIEHLDKAIDLCESKKIVFEPVLYPSETHGCQIQLQDDGLVRYNPDISIHMSHILGDHELHNDEQRIFTTHSDFFSSNAKISHMFMERSMAREQLVAITGKHDPRVMEDLDKAIEIDPMNAIALTRRAYIHKHADRVQLAYQDYLVAAKLMKPGDRHRFGAYYESAGLALLLNAEKARKNSGVIDYNEIERIQHLRRLAQEEEKLAKKINTMEQHVRVMNAYDGAKNYVETTLKMFTNVKKQWKSMECCKKCGKSQEDLKKEGSTLKYCKACKKVYYCGAACQKTDWKDHKEKCKQLQSGGGSEGNTAAFLIVDPQTGEQIVGRRDTNTGTMEVGIGPHSANMIKEKIREDNRKNK